MKTCGIIYYKLLFQGRLRNEIESIFNGRFDVGTLLGTCPVCQCPNGGSFYRYGVCNRFANADADVISFTTDITVNGALDINRSVTFELNGHTFTRDKTQFNLKTANITVTFQSTGDTQGKVITGDDSIYPYKDGITLNFNNVDFKSGFDCIYPGNGCSISTFTINAQNSKFTSGNGQGAFFNDRYTSGSVAVSVTAVHCNFATATNIKIQSGSNRNTTVTATYTDCRISASSTIESGRLNETLYGGIVTGLIGGSLSTTNATLTVGPCPAEVVSAYGADLYAEAPTFIVDKTTVEKYVSILTNTDLVPTETNANPRTTVFAPVNVITYQHIRNYYSATLDGLVRDEVHTKTSYAPYGKATLITTPVVADAGDSYGTLAWRAQDGTIYEAGETITVTEDTTLQEVFLVSSISQLQTVINNLKGYAMLACDLTNSTSTIIGSGTLDFNGHTISGSTTDMFELKNDGVTKFVNTASTPVTIVHTDSSTSSNDAFVFLNVKNLYLDLYFGDNIVIQTTQNLVSNSANDLADIFISVDSDVTLTSSASRYLFKQNQANKALTAVDIVLGENCKITSNCTSTPKLINNQSASTTTSLTLTVKGGTYTLPSASDTAEYWATPTSVSIEGGTFNAQIPTSLLAEHKVLTDNQNGTYTVSCNHVWNDGEVTKEPTCALAGEKTYLCTLCGGNKVEPVNATGLHSYENQDGLAPTCIADGYTAYQKCSVCQDVAGKTVLNALNHDFNGTVMGITYPNGLSANGKKEIKCTRCTETDDSTETSPIIVVEGYSTCEIEQNGQILVGYSINQIALAEYVDYNSTFTFGVLVGFGDNTVATNFASVLAGNENEKVFGIEVDTSYSRVNVTIEGITANDGDIPLVICAFTKQGADVAYYQSATGTAIGETGFKKVTYAELK